MIQATKNRIVVSRKPHTCDGCLRTFPKGTPMEVINLCDNIERTFSMSYMCPTCQVIIPHDGHEYEVGEYLEKALAYEAEHLKCFIKD